MAQYWFRHTVESPGQGPFSAAELKARAAAGEITAESFVSGDNKIWVPAPQVKGLFTTPSVPPRLEPGTPSPPQRREANTYAVGQETKACPYCGEGILAVAIKCKHCGERLDSASGGRMAAALTGHASQTAGSPQTTHGGVEAAIPPSPPPFSIGGALSGGWSAMAGNYGTLLAVVVLFILIQIGVSIVEAVINAGDAILGALVSLGTIVFLMPPIQAGWSYFGVKIYRGEAVTVGNLFYGFSRYWAVIGINVLIGLVMIGCMILMIIGIGIGGALSQASETVGIVVMIIAGVVGLVLVVGIGVRLSFAVLACLDPLQGRLGVIESMRASWRLAHPIVGRLLLLYILLGLIVCGTVLLLIVGMIFLGLPLAVASMGAAYCMAAGGSSPVK